MKFGIRKPSFAKRFAARTSWKRFARHSLGLKAPRGWGWLTNPKKAAYNRIYNRTSVSLDRLLTKGTTRRHRRASSATKPSGCGRLIGILLVIYLLIAVFRNISAAHLSLIIVVLVIITGAFFWSKRKRAADAAAAEEAARQARTSELLERFGAENTRRILDGELWVGATSEMVMAMLGPPSRLEERILKTKTKTVYKYFQTGLNRFALRVTLDDGVVVKWDDKR